MAAEKKSRARSKTQSPSPLEPRAHDECDSVSELADPLAPRSQDDLSREPEVHRYGSHARCDTDERGYPTRHNQSPDALRVDASEGFIPLWARDMVLRWTFHNYSFWYFRNPTGAAQYVRTLMQDALHAWGAAAPVRFKETSDTWDFQIYMRSQDDCNRSGCVLARAFFPDSGRHRLELYPAMFRQSRKEQVDTFIHEFGHVFGLRHFFANVSERAYPSKLFGSDSPFSIMNYGHMSELTVNDRNDLATLYANVWNGNLTDITARWRRRFVAWTNDSGDARHRWPRDGWSGRRRSSGMAT